MKHWKSIPKGDWSCLTDYAVGIGGGIGKYKASYVINIEKGMLLNGSISAKFLFGDSPLAGAGLVFRADCH